MRTRKEATGYTSKEYLEFFLEKRDLKLELTDTKLQVKTKEGEVIIEGELTKDVNDSCRQLTTLIVRKYGNKNKGRERLLQGRE